jgi:hypothetical protein
MKDCDTAVRAVGIADPVAYFLSFVPHLATLSVSRLLETADEWISIYSNGGMVIERGKKEIHR